MNTHTIVVGIHQNVLKTREDIDSQNRVVSGIRSFCITELAFITSQIQNRSVVLTAGGSGVSHSHLALLENPHLQHREPTLDAASWPIRSSVW